MTQPFNLNSFLQEYKGYNARKYTAVENGAAAMEERSIQRAEEAVNASNLLSLTLKEKLIELGLGENVVQQLGNSAAGLVMDLVNPVTDYLEKYENIFDQDRYIADIQTYAKQMFFAKQALTEDASTRAMGQKFVYNM